jgi:hypothetical protein
LKSIMGLSIDCGDQKVETVFEKSICFVKLSEIFETKPVGCVWSKLSLTPWISMQAKSCRLQITTSVQ